MSETDTTFFTRLRHAGQVVERGVPELQARVESGTSDEYCHAQALKTLQDMKKDVKKMKHEAHTHKDSMQEDHSKFEEILTLCQALVADKQDTLTKVEHYLSQYGYTAPVKVQPCGKSDEEEKKIATKEDVFTPPVSPAHDARSALNRTPKLEDYGVSSFTLQAMSRFKWREPTVSQYGSPAYYHSTQAETDRSRIMSVPSAFQHNGLFMTPSVLGGRIVSMETPDVTQMGEDGVCPMSQTPGTWQGYVQHRPSFASKDPIPRMKLEDEVAMFNTGSPIPPVFHTPGVKQIRDPRLSDVVKQETQGARCGSAEPETSSSDSPVVPILHMTGVKQITKSMQFNSIQSQMPSRPPTNDDTPPPPELTMSLHALSEITGSFNSGRMPRAPASLAEKFGHQVGKNATPTTPDLLSHRLSRMVHQSENVDSTTPLRGVISTVYTDMPEPPKLLGKYSFLSQENMAPK